MKRSAVLALVLVYLAMAAAALVSRQTFERLPHLEDEFAYLFQARIFQHAEPYIETPQPNRAYWQPFLINLNNKRFSKYPPGWSLLLAVGTGLNLPWVVNVWFGGLTVALVYRFGRELYDDTAGVAAALLMTISPIALLLNGTLMGHTSALFFTTLFAYGLWRVERRRRALMWGAVAGMALGMLIASRPLIAIAVAFPFVVYSGLRLIRAFWDKRENVMPTLKPKRTIYTHDGASADKRENVMPTLKPLLMVCLFTVLYGSMLAAYNYTVSGSATTNLYTYIWSYDKIGFGPGHGRTGGVQVFNLNQAGIKINMITYEGHTPDRGWEKTKRDTKCYFRDLFGWVMHPDSPPDTITLGNECLVDRPGLSWGLLPFGLLFMRRRQWSLLLLGMGASVILIHIAYWIGAGVYSARYYFEATSAIALVSGAGISGLARQADRFHLRYGLYALLGIAAAVSVIGFTPQRLESLRGYGRVSRDLIAEVERLRESPDIPVLVIASGEHHWRDIAPLMSLTDPYATSDIIALRDSDQSYLPILQERYPDRQIMFLIGGELIPINSTPSESP